MDTEVCAVAGSPSPADSSLIACPACGLSVPPAPTCYCAQPREARCVKDHSVIEGCPFEPLRAKSREPWVQEIFKPLPPEEAEALRYIDGAGYDDDASPPAADSAPYPDAADLRSALQWLLDDMADAGETHRDDGDASTIFDSVEGAARALINAGGTLSWYPGDKPRVPVLDAKGELHGYASTTTEALEVARTRMPRTPPGFCHTVTLKAPIALRGNEALPTAYVIDA